MTLNIHPDYYKIQQEPAPNPSLTHGIGTESCASPDTKLRRCRWKATLADLDQLKAMPQVPVPVVGPVPADAPGH
jgi:hypothetical protein